jgi:hypothetical protein
VSEFSFSQSPEDEDPYAGDLGLTADPYGGDLGLTDDQWHNLQMDYYYRDVEPDEGSVEAAAFRYLDACAREDIDRKWRAEELDQAYARYVSRPFPGGPLTACLTSREAAELAAALRRGEQAASLAQRDLNWRSALHASRAHMADEIEGLASDVTAETIISGLRPPGESLQEFRDRCWRESARVPDTSCFAELLEPVIDPPDVPPWGEPRWTEPEAEP